jgi:hypothetical protein
MAKFHGKIGYASPVETAPGVHKNVISEREYYGDVIRESRNWRESNQVNDNLTVSNRISITADDFANANFSAMRYVIWDEVYWKVTTVEVQRPRLILSLGGVYNGVKA